MKRINKIKAYLTRVLAVTMVIIMAAPPAPTYALNYGDPAIIRFGPKEGPDLSHSNYIDVPRDRSRITYAIERVGHPLAKASGFNETAMENLGSGDRPVLPAFGASLS